MNKPEICYCGHPKECHEAKKLDGVSHRSSAYGTGQPEFMYSYGYCEHCLCITYHEINQQEHDQT